MSVPKKILFVCTINRMRNARAHEMYKSDDRFVIDSARTVDEARNKIKHTNLEWADVIIVMERHHRKGMFRFLNLIKIMDQITIH